MFPFCFLAVRADSVLEESGLDTSKLEGCKRPITSAECKTSGHKVAPIYSCHEKVSCNEKECYEKGYITDRYHRFSKMSQAPVWQTMSASSLRCLIEQFASTDVGNLETLQRREPRGVYSDMVIGEHSLRLQALVWPIDDQTTLSSERESSLLLILSPTVGSYLPIGSSLTVAENNLLHSAPHIRWASHPSCLYTQVFGDWRKQFTVKILLPNALPKTLPALSFAC